jgi:hypothetical protein
MPEPQQQQQRQQGVAMPQVNPNMLVADDYVYEAKPVEEKEDTSQNAQSGGMSSQFEIVSSALDRNI